MANDLFRPRQSDERHPQQSGPICNATKPGRTRMTLFASTICRVRRLRSARIWFMGRRMSQDASARKMRTSNSVYAAAAAASQIPIFTADANSLWVPDRAAGDDFLPPKSGAAPVVSDKEHA